MKFSPEHFQTLKECIAPIISEIPKEGKSETRYLWDVFWASKWSQAHRDQYNDGDYYDSHIQTAVKRAVNELTNLNN